MRVFEIQSTILLYICLLLFITINFVFACGVCNTMMLIYIIPIFIPFFIFSFLYGVVAFSYVQTSKIVIVCVIWFVCLFITAGFPAGPIPIVGSTLYSFISPHSSLKKSYKNKKIDCHQYNNLKVKLNKLLVGAILLATVSGVGWQIYAPTYFDNHLIRMLRTHGAPTVFKASNRLMSIKDPEKQSQYIPELTRLLEGENESRWIQKEIYKILAVWKNPDATLAVAEIFNNIKYTDYSKASIAREAAKTLIALNKDLAAELIPPKIEEIKTVSSALGGHYDMLLGTFMECIINTDDTTAMSLVLTDENMDVIITNTRYTNSGDPARDALKALGAPSYGQDSDAYRRWWENEGKKKFEFLK